MGENSSESNDKNLSLEVKVIKCSSEAAQERFDVWDANPCATIEWISYEYRVECNNGETELHFLLLFFHCKLNWNLTFCKYSMVYAYEGWGSVDVCICPMSGMNILDICMRPKMLNKLEPVHWGSRARICMTQSIGKCCTELKSKNQQIEIPTAHMHNAPINNKGRNETTAKSKKMGAEPSSGSEWINSAWNVYGMVAVVTSG